MPLDAGRWIVRAALTGSRDGDTFDAQYDLSFEVKP